MANKPSPVINTVSEVLAWLQNHTLFETGTTLCMDDVMYGSVTNTCVKENPCMVLIPSSV
jgi:hypothetical protein